MMRQFLLALSYFGACVAQTISNSDGYTGYSLTLRGDDEEQDSVHYETDSTDVGGVDLTGPPDVYLKANVDVGEIYIDVEELTAEINIKAQVLNLLTFNAGVDVSIEKVTLDIQNVSASVQLEARLGNLVRMINDTLDSIDLNPILAILGSDVGDLLNGTATAVGGLTGSNSTSSSTLATRSDQQQPFSLVEGILYSVNSYSRDTSTNYILDQSGNIIAQSLHNDGTVYATQTVGSYWHDMTPNGHEHALIIDGQTVMMREYTYEPHPGLDIVAAIYIDASGYVVATKVLAESGAIASSTISNDD